MGYDAKVTSKGQITLPAKLREQMGLEAGDHIEFIQEADGSVAVRKKDVSFQSLRGLIKLDKPIGSEDIDDWVKAARTALGTKS